MSTYVWNETTLLERYDVFGYIYFIPIRPILLKHLKELYILYNKDLTSDFISLPFGKDELNTQNVTKEIQFIKRDLLNNQYFLKQMNCLKAIALMANENRIYEIDFMVLNAIRERMKKEKNQKFSKLFIEISDYVFQYFLNMNFSILTIDKMIHFLKTKQSLDLYVLPCLVTAFFNYILYKQKNNH